MVFSYDVLGAGVTLIDFHIRRCHSIGSGGSLLAGGIAKYGGATTFTMLRGSISGCTGRQIGGVLFSGGFNSLTDVLINDCHAFGTEYEDEKFGTTVFIGAGGILIGSGTLTMNDGAIRNCHAPHGNGGGVKSGDDGVQMELSRVTVQGCTAERGGGMYLEENTDARLTDVRIEDCEALVEHCCASGLGGGGMFMNEGSTLRAERVHMARCRAPRTGGSALMLAGGTTTTWIDSTFSDCTGDYTTILIREGTHTFTRIVIERCVATSTTGRGAGAGLMVNGGTTTLLDSRIADTGTQYSNVAGGDLGGCIFVFGAATMAVRNATLSNCTSRAGPYIHLASARAASAFRAELLTLVHPCEVEHSGALISVGEPTSEEMHIRGLQVNTCASSSPMVLDDGMRLSRCSNDDDGDVCGAAATCTDMVPLLSAPNLTSVDCSCTGETFPAPTAASAALAPYGVDPSIDFCVTPRVPEAANLDGFVLEKVIRLSKTGSANDAHTLDLKMLIGGTDVYPANWTIDASSVPFWLSLPSLQGMIGATEQTGNLSLTASTNGLAERLSTPYEALLNLSVVSQRGNAFPVLVKLYVSASTVASTSIWGTNNDGGLCDDTASEEKETLNVQLGSPLATSFTACDLDRLPVDHDDGSNFKASLTDLSGHTVFKLPIAYTGYGRYTVSVDAPKMGLFLLRLSLASANGTTELVSFERSVKIVCAAGYYASLLSECISCPPGTLCETIGINILSLPLQAGWWRMSNTSIDVKQCPNFKSSSSVCVGGDGAGVDACKDSLDGPFCVLCRGGVGHYYDKDDKTCYECGADTR